MSGLPFATRYARRLAALACVVLTWTVVSGHVGTNQVVMEGKAGGYDVRVMIDPPGVVPAQVPILVRVLNGAPTRVTVRAAQWNVGTKGAPPSEAMTVVAGEPGLWSHDLWIMTSSTYAVYVATEGPAGSGTLVVPLETTATRTLGMNAGMSALLLVLGALLVAGVLSIVGASAREGSLPPGVEPTPARRRRARSATAMAAGVIALALIGGAKWWNAEEAAYRATLYKPMAISTSVSTIDGDRLLRIAIRDTTWRTNRRQPLIPDHGKLMHLFLIGVGQENAIAHLHPLRVQADSFVTRVPELPAGRYLLFGDLLFQSGMQRTVVDTIELPVAPVVAENAGRTVAPSAAVSKFIDADDAWRVVTPVAFGDSVVLASGGSIRLMADGDVRAKRDLRLAVTMRDADGSTSKTESYMGMGGHAMVLRRDAGVFMHLHPMGSASMTAQAQLLGRERGDTVRLDSAAIAMMMAMPNMADTPTPETVAHAKLYFPFAFPSAGDYRVFVQIKRRGVVETAAFDVTVPAVAARIAGRVTPP